MNITLEIVAMNGKSLQTKQPVTFYSIDNITTVPESKSAIIMSGGREYIASCSYEELWEKLKRHSNESAIRK
jgi:uncharacterized protein YlzI (FlbEa/FlbD family)